MSWIRFYLTWKGKWGWLYRVKIDILTMYLVLPYSTVVVFILSIQHILALKICVLHIWSLAIKRTYIRGMRIWSSLFWHICSSWKISGLNSGHKIIHVFSQVSLALNDPASLSQTTPFNWLVPWQNGRNHADAIWIAFSSVTDFDTVIENSFNCVPRNPIYNNSALIWIMP